MLKGSKHTEETRKKMKKSSATKRPWMIGKGHTQETKDKIRDALLGRKQPPRSEEHRKKIGDNHRGEKSNWWKGGITPVNKRIRKSPNMTEWRKLIFERDNYTCQECGERGTKIHPHHIIPFSILLDDMRFELGLVEVENIFENAMKYTKLWDIQNGITLCYSCHKNTDSYGVNIKKGKDMV